MEKLGKMVLNTAPAYVKCDLMGVANSVKKDVLFIMILGSPIPLIEMPSSSHECGGHWTCVELQFSGGRNPRIIAAVHTIVIVPVDNSTTVIADVHTIVKVPFKD